MTPAECDRLRDAIAAAIPVSGKARGVEQALAWQCVALRDAPDTAPPEFRSLRTVLAEIPALECFEHAEQRSIWPRMAISPGFLLYWLLSRAQITDAPRAVADLQRYLGVTEIELDDVLHIDGIDLKETVAIGALELIPWSHVPMSDTRWQLIARYGIGHMPTAAVRRRFKVGRTHIRPWDPPPPFQPYSLEPSLDLLRCCTAVRLAPWRLLHQTVEAPDWAPWEPDSQSFGSDGTASAMSVPLTAEQVPRLLACASAFAQLEPSAKDRLRISLDRLNRSLLAGLRHVDVAIELGIGMESLFSPTKLGEGIAFAIRTRAAKWIGGSTEDRHATSALVRDLYELRSMAVHSGRFDAPDAPKKWRDAARVADTLRQGQTLLAGSLEKVVTAGEPNWSALDLG